jgi:hypothetical protein
MRTAFGTATIGPVGKLHTEASNGPAEAPPGRLPIGGFGAQLGSGSMSGPGFGRPVLGIAVTEGRFPGGGGYPRPRRD